MKKHVRLTDKQKVDIIIGYRDRLERMTDLAKKYGITRQAVWKVLKKHGVDTSKKRLPVSCTVCGKIVYRPRCQIRSRLHIFCSQECYGIYLLGGYNPVVNRHGQRIGRKIVSQYFALQEGHVVHHENHNQTDNRIENLRVFACQGDHMRYHRGFDVEPVFDGRTVSTWKIGD